MQGLNFLGPILLLSPPPPPPPPQKKKQKQKQKQKKNGLCDQDNLRESSLGKKRA